MDGINRDELNVAIPDHLQRITQQNSKEKSTQEVPFDELEDP